MLYRSFIAASLLPLAFLLSSCTSGSDRAFYAAAARVESLLADEWKGVIQITGTGPDWDTTFLQWPVERDYMQWRLLNIERHAEFGQRLRPPKTVPDAWVRHWDAALEAFVAQGALAFRATREIDPALMTKALDLCESGWLEMGRRGEQTIPGAPEPLR